MSPPAAPPLLPTRLRRVSFVLLFILAGVLRLAGVAEPALEFAPVRQYRSLLIARGLDWRDSEDPARAAVGRACLERNRPLEPPVMERVTAAAWGVTGEESIAFPRTLSTLLWLAGGAALAVLAARLLSPDAALVAATFHLLAPFGVRAGRSFQPDPLMMACTLAALLAFERFGRSPSRRGAAVVGLAAGAALFVKPVALPVLALGGAALAARGLGVRGLLRSRLAWGAALAALVPTAAYYLWGIWGAGFLGGQAEQTFSPELWARASFWRGWLRLAAGVVGPVLLAAGPLGALLAPRGARLPLAALWLGYVAQSLAFSHHAYTHDYYHLFLLPLVALSLGAAATLPARVPGRTGPRAALLGALWLALGAWLLGAERGGAVQRDAAAEVALAEAVGEVVGPSTSVVCLAPDLGKPLQFHGGFVAWNWPWSRVIEGWRRKGLPAATVPERLRELTGGPWPDWFAVAQERELGRQPELVDFLSRYPVAGAGDGWRVVDLRGGPPPAAD